MTKLAIASLSRQDIPELDRRPHFLYIDEVQGFTHGMDLPTILSEARKYGLSRNPIECPLFYHDQDGHLQFVEMRVETELPTLRHADDWRAVIVRWQEVRRACRAFCECAIREADPQPGDSTAACQNLAGRCLIGLSRKAGGPRSGISARCSRGLPEPPGQSATRLAGITYLRTGQPFSLAFSATQVGWLSGRPDARRDRTLSRSKRSEYRWFGASAYALPAPFTYGNSARNLLFTPGDIVLDISVLKDTGLHERATLQFRAEFLSFPNHANLGGPGTNISVAATVGRITSVGDPRQIQFGLNLLS